MVASVLLQPIEYLNGVSAVRGDLLRKEIAVYTIGDLLEHYPLRHLDKTKVDKIAELHNGADYTQVAGRLVSKDILGERRAKRLVAQLQDDTGIIELVWFQGIPWVDKLLQTGKSYLVFGKLSFFGQKPQLAHPELEPLRTDLAEGKKHWEAIYPSTEKLKAKGLNGKAIGKLVEDAFRKISPDDLPENIPAALLDKYKLKGRYDAFRHIHLPVNMDAYQQAVRRLKFEEFFISQLHIQSMKKTRLRASRGLVFEQVGDAFNTFYNQYLPFPLTEAQKRVLREIRKDLVTGKQMNRLLQGDVGSGKTIVALLTMLIACDNGYQSVLMAPTEILAQQHYETIATLLKDTGMQVALLTGSTSARNRKPLLERCADGSIQILIGTHAVIEDTVRFHNLGMAVVDEQHKFGVAQRARLWKKNTIPPHVLVMTATPIPRTLAMTIYGDLDYSVIDELPPGRKPVTTHHRFENSRPAVMDFIKKEITAGRQAYIIYPLIEESSKMDYENLMKGYEEVKSFFPEPAFWVSMVHGKQTPEQKETNMQRFAANDTQILVGTTVIEVGVNVPNATVMVIESAEKFGLSQLHQLRGRVGRGADKSYCILLTGFRISKEARERMKIMESTTDGFKIAEKDLELRGPGEMEGTRQSGALLFKLARVVEDRPMLEEAAKAVDSLLDADPDLQHPDNQGLRRYLQSRKGGSGWSRIS
jgi:ATP-dependent DNA helicase RecG